MCQKEKKCSYCKNDIPEGKETFCSDECADKAYNEYMTIQTNNRLKELYETNKTFRDTAVYHMK